MFAFVALLTDFGLSDPYVGQMKAVLLREAPGCTILDLTHEVEPHNVLQAGFFLAASWPYLPQGGLAVAIVDPGVGTARGLLLLQKNGRYALVPDNGLLSLLLERPGENLIRSVKAPELLREASSTFHGRDVFAPLAARMARRTDPERLGAVVPEHGVVRLPHGAPRLESGRLEARVLHVDRFGNCILNLDSNAWSTWVQQQSPRLVEPVRLEVHPVSAYAQIPDQELGILDGSQGYLELAANRASCAARLGLRIGDACRFRTR